MRNHDKNDILRKIDAFIKHSRERTLNKATFASIRKINGEICQAKGVYLKDGIYRLLIDIGFNNKLKFDLDRLENQEILKIFNCLKDEMEKKLL